MKRHTGLAVSDHAVARLAERADAGYLGAQWLRERLREVVERALRDGSAETHYVEGQRRVRVDVLGVALYAVVGRDETGFTRGGEAVVTCLTLEQVAAGWRK